MSVPASVSLDRVRPLPSVSTPVERPSSLARGIGWGLLFAAPLWLAILSGGYVLMRVVG